MEEAITTFTESPLKKLHNLSEAVLDTSKMCPHDSSFGGQPRGWERSSGGGCQTSGLYSRIHCITFPDSKRYRMLLAAIFLALILIVLLIAASMPNHFNIEKTVVINKPVEEVMSRVGDLNFYKQWNPWQQADPSAKSEITGTPGTPGHRYEWQGKKVGVGNLTLREINSKHIHFDLQFLKPWKSQAKDNWLFEPWGNNETKVTWQNSGALPWPIARLMGPMLTKNLNHQFEKGLNNLKSMCEGADHT